MGLMEYITNQQREGIQIVYDSQLTNDLEITKLYLRPNQVNLTLECLVEVENYIPLTNYIKQYFKPKHREMKNQGNDHWFYSLDGLNTFNIIFHLDVNTYAEIDIEHLKLNS